MTPTFFTNLGEGPTVVDTNSSAVMVILKGNEVPDTIIDGGSRVNVSKKNMRHVGYPGMGAMPVPVANGRHKFGTTNRTPD